MREIAAYRERCRSENPGARTIGELALEKLRRGERRTAELRSVTEDLDPAHAVRRGGFLHSRQRAARLFRSPRTRREAFGALGLLLERFRERIERARQRFQGRSESVPTRCLCPGHPRGLAAERKAQIARAALEPLRKALEVR